MDDQFRVLVQVAAAMVLGGVVGIERELARRPAGLRTHMLVAGAAALLVGMADSLIEQFYLDDSDLVRSDPIRIVQSIIIGISFLGAGTIMRHPEQQHVEGLTTAASILISSGIGVAVALDKYLLAGGVTVLALAVLRGCNFLEAWLHRRSKKPNGA
jgi:putative Mg2+ transporter-C (MgtC) family protein